MSKNRPAILSSALVARKGMAEPTGYTPVRPQDIVTAVYANQDPGTSSNSSRPRPVLAPVPASNNSPAPTNSRRARVSVRLDRDRHLKLRLTAAHLDNSLQDVMTDALDRYLEQISPEVLRNDCACLGVANPAATGATAPRSWQPE
jgi:hypothetical protein